MEQNSKIRALNILISEAQKKLEKERVPMYIPDKHEFVELVRNTKLRVSDLMMVYEVNRYQLSKEIAYIQTYANIYLNEGEAIIYVPYVGPRISKNGVEIEHNRGKIHANILKNSVKVWQMTRTIELIEYNKNEFKADDRKTTKRKNQ